MVVCAAARFVLPALRTARLIRPVNKEALRAEMKVRLLAVSAQSRRAASQHICQAIQHTRAWQEAALVCAFLPLASEPQISPLWAAEPGHAFCFPRVLGDEVELIRITDCAQLAAADWRLATFPEAPVVAPESVDLILVPGIAFTRDGHRLGRGGGYYDRLLALLPTRTVKLGVCFDHQLLPDLPTEPHDMRVDAVVTGTAPTNPDPAR